LSLSAMKEVIYEERVESKYGSNKKHDRRKFDIAEKCPNSESSNVKQVKNNYDH
jgi:hypothetical protein